MLKSVCYSSRKSLVSIIVENHFFHRFLSTLVRFMFNHSSHVRLSITWEDHGTAVSLRIYNMFSERTCPTGSFQCDNTPASCIYQIQVCDGRRDCPGGYDENPDMCDNRFVLCTFSQ